MRTCTIIAAAILLSCSCVCARSQQRAESGLKSEDLNDTSARKSFFILAEFAESLNAKKLKVGDKIKAEVVQDVLSHGKIVIPSGSKLLGHVTEAKVRGPVEAESRLGIVFDRISIGHSLEVDFEGVVHRVEPPAVRMSRVDEPDQMMPPSMIGRSSPNMGNMGPGPNPSLTSGASGVQGMSVSGAPVTMNGTPGSNVGNASGGDLNHSSSGNRLNRAAASPMSVGMPQGVFGIKDLELDPGPTANTPGPVIVSFKKNIKLEYGTQVLIKAKNPRVTNH